MARGIWVLMTRTRDCDENEVSMCFQTSAANGNATI
jgi:hypothetical protein